jgi:hypothetical protein
MPPVLYGIDMRVVGWDTETFQGRVKCLATSTGRVVESSDPDTLLAAIVDEGRNADLLVTWNLDFDVGAVLKPYVESHVEVLRESHYRRIKLLLRYGGIREYARLEGRRLTAEEIKELRAIMDELGSLSPWDFFSTPRHDVRIIGSKGFGVRPRYGSRRNRKYVWSYDAGAAYQTGKGHHMKLDTAAKKYLGLHKSDKELGIDRESVGTIPGYYESHREAIIKYCIQDAYLTARLMEHTILGFERLGIPFPERPFSSGSIAKCFLSNRPDHEIIIKEVQRLETVVPEAGEAYSGGVFLLFKAGRQERPYMLDINSAYPAALATLPSLVGAKVVEYGDPAFEDCFYRFYRIRTTPCLQLPLRDKASRRKVYRVSGDEQLYTVTGPDLDLLHELGHPFVIQGGVAIQVVDKTKMAFPWVRDLYAEKARLKRELGEDSPEYMAVKLVLNSMYGVLAQTRPRRSSITCLIEAGYVTALCRQQLWREAKRIEDAGDEVIMLATDGIAAVGDNFRETARAENSAALGEWEFEEADEGVYFESGVYALRFGKEWVMKVRGLPGITVKDLMECPEPTYTVVFKSPLHLKSSIIQRRPEDLGIFEDQKRELDPARAAYEAGWGVPVSMVDAPLSDYFKRSWRLWPPGSVPDEPLGIVPSER